MTHLAAWTWARGGRHVSATELEDWFGTWLEEEPALRHRYAPIDRDKLEADPRGFDAREVDDGSRCPCSQGE